ncbi:hypothetical protein F442_02537 [Phytophthora nicotianae P10297]|nr:hypothetical protein F442_02537 [Phytophthora nicotianae P10297]
MLVGAPTEKVYDSIITTMKVVLRSETARQLWFDYFDTNWTACKEMWSSINRGNVPHMGNHTNNRDHEEDMPQCGVTVQTGRVVYDVKMLKAMRSWHTAMTHFHGIENAIKWVKEYDDTQYNPQDPDWCDGILEKSELVTLLNEVNVLGDYYWVTSLSGRIQLEGPCMDLALQTIIKRFSTRATIFTVPADVLRFPIYDTETLPTLNVWNELKESADSLEQARESSEAILFLEWLITNRITGV